MEITTKDQRMFRFKFSVMQQLESCYFTIMMSTQVNRHSNLFAYKYLEGIQKQKGESISSVCYNDVVKIVSQDFNRFGAFARPELYSLVDFNLEPGSKKVIVYTKLNHQSEKQQLTGYFVPTEVDPEDLVQAFDVRYKGRFPTLAYVYKNGN